MTRELRDPEDVILSDRDRELATHLEETSRTFALAIPLLPERTRQAVTAAYLLFRIADTFEDGHLWPWQRRVEALHAFDALLDETDLDRVRKLGEAWAVDQPLRHEGYLQLLRRSHVVVEAMHDLPLAARREVRTHTGRTVRQMAAFVERTGEEGVLRLTGVDDLRAYCYAVAGIVGEMLTELFILELPAMDEERATELRALAPRFGEALQLVNILRDASDDARDGRVYVPPTVDRGELFALARGDLEDARRYTRLLEEAGAAPGIVAFTALPAELAVATLDLVEEKGPGAKVSRDTVAEVLARVGMGA